VLRQDADGTRRHVEGLPYGLLKGKALRGDWDVYYGIAQSAFACVAAWLEFRLPPISDVHSTE